MSHFARSTLIIAVFFGLDKVVGFIRALLVNNQFGLSYELDVFNAANNIPDLLSALISGGALGVALIPILSEYLQQRGRPAMWGLFARIINLGFIVTASFAIIIFSVTPWLIANVIAPGFPAEQQSLAAELMRLDLIAILIFSISGLVMAGLQANQHFLLPALAPTLYNLGQIFGATVLSPETAYSLGPITIPALGLGVHGLVYGVILGALLHLAIQIPALIKLEFTWQPKIDLRSPGVRQVLKLLGPRVLTMFFIQMFFIVRDNLASGMGEGAVTALNLGWFIMQVPETLLGTAVAIAMLPTISEIFARGEHEKFRETVNGAVRAILSLTIPSAVFLAIGLPALVATAFPGYTPTEVGLIVLITRIYLLGLTGHALLEISARSFYAQKNAITPLFAAALNATGYVMLAFWLSARFGIGGIAFANIIAFTLEAAILLWLLNRKFPGLLQFGQVPVRVLLGASSGAGVVYLIIQFAPVGRVVASLGGMLLGLATAGLFLWPELKPLLKLGADSADSP